MKKSNVCFFQSCHDKKNVIINLVTSTKKQIFGKPIFETNRNKFDLFLSQFYKAKTKKQFNNVKKKFER